jgi:hypothetical protein
VAHATGEHEKVRFRREEITPLDSFPSACLRPPAICRGKASRLWRWLLWPAATFAALVLILCGALYLIGVDAIGNERLRQQAEHAIEQIAGVEVDVTLGGLRLGLGKSSLFALEVHDARIVRSSDKTPIADAGLLRFGLRSIPLLSGRVEIVRVAMADAQLTPSQVAAGDGPDLATLIAQSAAVGPEQLSNAIFETVHRAFTVTRNAGLKEVSLANIGFLTDGQELPGLVIEKLEIERGSDTGIVLDGLAKYHGRSIAFGGTASRDAATQRVDALTLRITAPAAEGAAPPAGTGLVRAMGAFDLSLSGREAGGPGRGFIGVEMRTGAMLLGLGQDEIPLDGTILSLAASEGDAVFSVLEAHLATGRTRVNFQGTVGPETGADADAEPGYRIDLVSRDSVLAPMDSPEQPLAFAVRLAGRFDPATMRLGIDQIDARTSEGELTGRASVMLAAGKAPGIGLSLEVRDMPTAHVKQFWPWFAAPGARNWTLKNVFGGRVRDSHLTFYVPPGRLGNGVPLGAEEVFGRFELSDTRFDIAGDIPPVRNGNGWVEFRGTYVRVGLSTGTIYMPDGGAIAASNGTLTLENAHLTPRIGKLEIDIAGKAGDVVELASYEPIDASRFHDLAPSDLTGDVSGHVSADIPLQAGIPAKNLRWKVALDYENLSIAKPFEGQEVTNAKGSLLVQPDRAEFAAEAELNAVPASLRIVEPLGGASVERVRRVELRVDDAARDRLFPGLGMLVSGPFTLLYEEQADKRAKVNVKLDRARLDVPWIGWRKGAGIAATANLVMARDGDTIELSDFTLRGDSFSLAGRIRLSGGQLREAHFDRVGFNRADNYAATIRNAGGRYDVTVKGAGFDARGLVKRVLDERRESGGGSGSDSVPVSVKASLQRVDSFNGEYLEHVELAYSSDGKGPDLMSLQAATSSHGEVRMAKTREEGRSVIRVNSSNAGAVLRFLDIYKHVEGGQLALALAGPDDVNLAGQLDIRDFWVVDEPRMRSLVAATDSSSGRVDATRVHFQRGAAMLSKGRQRLGITNGVLRGPLIGSTFQGTLFDPEDNMDITGTFMPLYGINRLFGELPLIGQILGNGRDRGLIGITYRLSGRVGEPMLQVNPLSAIAPGFLREIFEFR